MSNNHEKYLTLTIWALAVIITVLSAIYQRKTGPTKPGTYTVIVENESYSFDLKRSHNIIRDLYLRLEDTPPSLEGRVVYRRYPTDDEWTEKSFTRIGNDLEVQLPLQPPAGKIEYYLILESPGEVMKPGYDEPVIMRFRGDVPAMFMIPHILFMFLAMFFSNLTGIMVLFRDPRYRYWMKYAFWSLLLGGLVLGPVIQNFAFGQFWTGWPLGNDLTDNKTMVAFLFWALAMYKNRRSAKPRPAFALVAAIVLFAIYFIPHSMMGSELDYSTGEVVTGFLHNPLFMISQ